MRKGIRGIVFAAVMCSVPSCGGGDEGGPTRQACIAAPEEINDGFVDLKVEFTLPAELSTGCTAGQTDNLQVYVLIPGADTCDLSLNGSILSGCCPDIENASNQMLSLTAVYRDLASQQALAEQRKNQFLKTTSPRTVEVSFADEDIETEYYGNNLSSWCAGTL